MIARHRLAQAHLESSSHHFYPKVLGLPDLPPIRWDAIGHTAPQACSTPAGKLPTADIVVITWASAEWAAMEHVFVQSDQAMPYSAASTSYWDGWQKYDADMPVHPDAPDWTYWGYYRLVQVGKKTVLLFKSNTHLDWPGAPFLATLTERLCEQVKPSLVFSIGTAGGSRPQDHLGTVSVVNAGTMYEKGLPPIDWTTYRNAYRPNWSVIDHSGFSSLLFQIPATDVHLQSIASQFNTFYGSSYALDTLNADGLCTPTELPLLYDLTADGTSLLTAATFVVGTTDGNYKDFSVIEMDDAVIAKVCQHQGVPFGFVRNVSDPAQNPALPSEVQANWGSAIYDVFGFYTSFNGALAAWAVIAAMAD